MAVQYATRLVGVLIAFVLARFATAVHSAARGAQLLTEGAMAVAVRSGYLSAEKAADPQVRTALQVGLAVLGALSQFYAGFAVPFPLNVVLLPLSVLDGMLVMAVGLY
jgi:hypothetical protein